MKWLRKKILFIFSLLGFVFQEQSFAETVVVAEPTPPSVITIPKLSSTSSAVDTQSQSTSTSTAVQTASTKEQNDEDEDGENSLEAQTVISVEEEKDKVPEPTAVDMRVVLAQKEKLEVILKEYESLADKTGKAPQWTCINHSFRIKDQDPVLVTAKKQLHLLGFFAASKKAVDLKFTSFFSKKLEAAVKEFQRRHFLEPDGVIGRKTCIALNMTPDERIRKIKLNLERWKELEKSLQGKYVLVNVPTYKLYAMEDLKIDLTQPVIVGMKSRETPIFTCNMNSVVLNPAWGVPVTIFIKDKLSKVLKDPEYLSKSGFTVTDHDGEIVTDSSVDWKHVSLHHFPYTVRQMPGENNALGAIKFNLDNKEAIYLHGTPQKNLFHRIARSFSSGCVRLEAPQKLATWALKGTKYDNPEKLEEKISTGDTSAILLKHPIPVYFTYITVWVERKGEVMFSDDPYDLDKQDYARFNL
ncbi:MAG: L,D-transpeptidase family protein [Alphaproteobacteria bacterium]|nr:L,D-transpeptidase family protein [Alphaproteobacteria bacterium]